ncbi:unnamed protein product [Spodoptera exigua]|nr:unnamed protein product [Spodoptera exigua]
MKAVRYMRFSEFVHNEDRLIESGNKKACDKVGNPGVDAIACIVPNTCNDTGGAGSIRDAGGAFKKRGMAKESQYFYKKERELLQKIKESMNDQKRFHEEQIAVHKCALEKIKNKENTID